MAGAHFQYSVANATADRTKAAAGRGNRSEARPAIHSGVAPPHGLRGPGARYPSDYGFYESGNSPFCALREAILDVPLFVAVETNGKLMTVADTEQLHRSVSQRAMHLARLAEANDALGAAKRSRMAAEITAAQHRLRAAVDAAREAGAEWMAIGDVLGIARGNAYQKFRRRPHAAGLVRS